MSRRYRIVIAATGVALLVAVGGIAAAEQGGQSENHRQNPTTTSGPTTSVPPITAAANKTETSDTEGLETDSNRIAALCHALHQGSAQGQAMKAEHGQAFQGLECAGVAAPGSSGDEGDGTGGTEGPPEHSNAGGNGGGGQGQGSGNPHAANGQSHKP